MFKPNLLSFAISGAIFSTALTSTDTYAQATEVEEKQIEVIEVTATRRSGSVQEAPLNITALDADILKDQNIGELADIARWVPGLTVTDQGGRSKSPVIVRGLNTNSSGPDADAQTVATYINEIPLSIDLRLTDIERVEVLIGPQGTLYGAGTLGGAIRYMLKYPELDITSLEVNGDIFQVSESDSLGGEGGFIVNVPLIEDTLAVRASLNHYKDPGFIDYSYVVKEGGKSLANPNWDDPQSISDNLKQVKDANGETTTTGRISVKWAPNDEFDATLNYFFQKQDTEGRSIVHYDALNPNNSLNKHIKPYESGYRYEEPREKEDTLLSLELRAELGFAELVSATGFSEFEAHGQRDQTDLLVRLDFGYEEFPSFSAFTREDDKEETITQEIRLVSQSDSALSWIVGGFYNELKDEGSSKEITPGFGEWAVENLGAAQSRPDALEYYAVSDTTITESALFGEIGYQVNDKLNLNVGVRFYEYEVETESAVDTPLLNTMFYGADPTSTTLDLSTNSAEDDGSLFKFNANYQFTPTVMAYLTVSEGFRIGGSNGLDPCDIPLSDKQNICGMPDELLYTADTTTNYELGFKSTWMKNRLHFNAAVFNVDWDDAHIQGATDVGQFPYTSNAGTANAKGVEISTRAVLSDSLSVFATYAYTDSKLTSDAPYLFYADGREGAQDGDRLPGSAKQQFSLGVNYQTEVFDDKTLDINYGLTAQSDMISKVGLRDSGEIIPGYALSNISAKLTGEMWSATLYVNNLFDKYARTSVRRNRGDIISANGAEQLRNYGYYINRPMTVGLKFNYLFEL